MKLACILTIISIIIVRSESKLDDDGKKAFLDGHNNVRVALFQGKYGFLPRASERIPSLVWDDVLERHAQIHADKCKNKHSTGGAIRDAVNEEKGSADKYSSVGENLFMTGSACSVTQATIGKDTTADWMEEIDMYDDSTAACNQMKSFDINEYNLQDGHLTQMLWATTTKLGCAFNNTCWGDCSYFAVCLYGHGGNRHRKPVYQTTC